MKTRKKLRFKYAIRLVLSFVTLMGIWGCQKVINVDLNEAAPQMVIEGLINDAPGPYTVTISKSGSYFNQPVLEMVSGAQVIINDNNGTIDTLRELISGVYFTRKTRGVPGENIHFESYIRGSGIRWFFHYVQSCKHRFSDACKKRFSTFRFRREQ